MSATATRKSIAKYYPLGVVFSRGYDNPITVHAVDDHVLRCFWSFAAELMLIDGAICRFTKERIAKLVSLKNECSICVTAHSMLEQGAEMAGTSRYEEFESALVLAEQIHAVTTGGGSDKLSSGKLSSSLSPEAQAEVALVVFLYQHVNRVIDVILGEEMSTAMFGVPSGLARTYERPGTINKMMNKMMAPILARYMRPKHKAGITRPLFPDEVEEFSLPHHLGGAEAAGPERARALARLVDLLDPLYESRIKTDVSKEILQFVEDDANVPPVDVKGNFKIVNWVLIQMRPKIEEFTQGDDKAIKMITLLLMVRFVPKVVYRCKQWFDVTKIVGKEQTRLIAIWWSIRYTLAQAKGLEDAANTCVTINSDDSE